MNDDPSPFSARNVYTNPNDVDTPVLGEKWSEDAIHKALPNNFIPRPYQEEVYDEILSEHLDYAKRKHQAKFDGEEFYEPEPSWAKKAVQVLHRRAGKDIGALHLIAIASQLRVGNYKHILPFKTQARDAIWDGIDALGNRFIRNAFPDEIVESINESRMLVRFTNGSTYQLQGGDSDKLVGAGPVGIVYSESALMSPNVRTFLRPMLDETGGWELHITTPRGKNWFYKLAMHAEQSDDWYYKYLTIRDTWRWAYSSAVLDIDENEIHDSIPTELKFKNVVDAEIAINSGAIKAMYRVRIMTDAMVQSLKDEGQDPFIVDQEYYCDWDVALQGSYYGDMMMKAIKDKRIGNFPHNTNKPVYVHMDIGFNDATSITFSQESMTGAPIVIDHLWGSQKSLLDWCYQVESHANEHDYSIAMIVMPHDADNTEISHGKTRKEWVLDEGGFESRGLQFEVLERAEKQAGIDATRGFLANACIDEEKCEYLIESLKSYRREYDEKNQTYRNNPVHDWASHPADNVRYLASSWESVIGYTAPIARRRRGNQLKANIKVKRALH